MRALAIGLAALLVSLVAPPAAADVAVPPLRARVTDLTRTLDDAQRQALEHTLAEFEARKGAQIAVLVVPTTQPETIEQYAVRVEEAWKLGRRKVDDGVLLVVAKDDRRLRIEVGYGLEGAIPDAVAKRVIEEDIAPRFKQGDFYGGIRAGTDRLMRLVEGEKLPPPGAATPSATGPDGDWIGAAVIGLLVGGGLLRAIFGRFLGALLAGGAMGVVVWVVFSTLAWSAIAAIVAFLVVLLIDTSGVGRGGRSGNWGGGSWGGSSGGGFSGGGGSSGGGGASGSW